MVMLTISIRPLSALYILTLVTILDLHYYHFHFADVETNTNTDFVACPGPQSK